MRQNSRRKVHLASTRFGHHARTYPARTSHRQAQLDLTTVWGRFKGPFYWHIVTVPAPSCEPLTVMWIGRNCLTTQMQVRRHCDNLLALKTLSPSAMQVERASSK